LESAPSFYLQKFNVATAPTCSSNLHDCSSAAAPAPVVSGDAAEAKSEFDVVLTAVGDKKIDVIKAVKEVTQKRT